MPVRKNLDDPKWTAGETAEIIRGSSLRFNYLLCLEYGNTKKIAIIKACLARFGLRVCLNRDMPASLTIWYMLIEFNEKFF